MAELHDYNGGTTEISNSLAAFHRGSATLTDITIAATPGDIVPVEVSVPTLNVAPVDIDIVLLAQCPRGTSELLLQGNLICNQCKSGEYESMGSCVSCVTGMVCDEMGVFLQSVRLQAGFWRTDDDSDDIRPCRVGVISCPGDGKNQASANLPSKQRVTSSGATKRNPYCAPNYLGPLCSVCADGFFTSWAGDGECYECATGTSHLPTILLASGVLVFVAVCAVECAFRKVHRNPGLSTRTASIQKSTPSSFATAKHVYALAKFKIFTLFLTAQARKMALQSSNPYYT